MDIDIIRNNTKGCADKIFVNSAGGSLMPSSVVARMKQYLEQEELLGAYKVASMYRQEIDDFYVSIASLINCGSRNIAFASSSTDAYAKALSSIPFLPGDVILTTKNDYVSNQLAFLSLKGRHGVEVVRANNLESGDIDLNHFEQLILQYNPKLVAVTHIPSTSGIVQDVERIGKLCRTYNCWYLVDACQSVGQMKVDVDRIGCDFLTATGRKFLRGPRGTGFLYVSDRALQANLAPLFVDFHGAAWSDVNEFKMVDNAKRFEYFENSYGSLVGLKEAVRYINTIGIDLIETYNTELMLQFRNAMKEIPGLKLMDLGLRKSNILTFHVDGVELQHLENILSDNNIYYSVGFRSSSLFDLGEKDVDWVIRFSPHYFNTKEELSGIVKILSDYLSK